VKVLLDTETKSVERFLQEARATANLHCPNVVTVLDFARGDETEPPILVMELLAGEPLSDVLAREHRMPVSRAAAVAVQMLNGLAAAHRAGIIHRDVKPSNVFVVPTAIGDVVKLVDFGIAKVLNGQGGVKTTTGAFPGTPAYVAPEQLRMEHADARTDLHAVGVVLYEMLTGRRPWLDAGMAELSAAILREEPPPLRGLRPDAPDALAAIVMRALRKNRDERWQSAEEMMAALKPFVGAPEVSGGRAPQAPASAPPVLPRIVTAPLDDARPDPDATRRKNVAPPGRRYAADAADTERIAPPAVVAPPPTPRELRRQVPAISPKAMQAESAKRTTIVLVALSCVFALVGVLLISFAISRR
jgi:serine/threonine-protein kinase